jgi:hypothetical protein
MVFLLSQDVQNGVRAVLAVTSTTGGPGTTPAWFHPRCCFEHRVIGGWIGIRWAENRRAIRAISRAPGEGSNIRSMKHPEWAERQSVDTATDSARACTARSQQLVIRQEKA